MPTFAEVLITASTVVWSICQWGGALQILPWVPTYLIHQGEGQAEPPGHLSHTRLSRTRPITLMYSNPQLHLICIPM